MVSGISNNYTLANTVNYYNRQNKPVSFKADREKSDTVNLSQNDKRELSTGAKIAMYSSIALGLAVGADFLFCKGKHIKNLFAKQKGKTPKPEVKPEGNLGVKPEVNSNIRPESNSVVKPESNSVVKPESNSVVKPESNSVVKPESNSVVKPESNSVVKPESNSVVKPENNSVVKPESNSAVKPENNSVVKPEGNLEVKPESNPNVKPKIDPAVEAAKLNAKEEIEKLSKEIPNMSRAEIAKERMELYWNREIIILEEKANRIGLTELESVRLDCLKQKRALFDEREKQIAKSLEKYVPTVSENSAVSMHHSINGENPRIRAAIADQAINPSELNEYQLNNIKNMKKHIAEIDREFAQLPPLEKDCIVYRGRAEHPIINEYNADFKIIENAKAGDLVVPDIGYSYTGFHYDLANGWCQGGRMLDTNNKPLRTMMCQINLPKGAKVSRNLEHGGEIIMPRGAQYKVLDKKVAANGDIEVVLEYILPKAK